MQAKLTLSLCVLSCMAIASFHAQELTGATADQQIQGALKIRMNPEGTAPDFVVFDPAKAVATERQAELRQRLFGNRPEDSWSLIRSEDDDLGMTHARYQQLYKNIPVDGHVYLFHSRQGKIVSANGTFAPGLALSVIPAITADEAIGFAVAGMKAPLLREQADLLKADLVLARSGKGQIVLAYKCEVLRYAPLVNRIVYVDAQTGSVLREVSRVCETDVPGVAHTQFSGIQPITTDQVSASGYMLRESGRGSGIETYDNLTAIPYADADNTWDNVNPSQDEFATDVHFGAEVTYDFFHDNFGRDSYDDNGGMIRSYVNDQNVGVNAYWSGGSDNTMHYGNGDADNYYPVASLEVAGHELSHGVTEYSAGLEYSDESGALNESFSDIFGSTIRFLKAPDVASWYIGDQIIRPNSGGEPFRNMANPNEFLNPDTYGGQFFHTGDIVHFDSGIQNFWYYLLVEGGSGTNDVNNAFSVNAIGLHKAMKIAYRNLAYYLTPLSDFADARDGSEQAAIDLFGICSQEHTEVIHAWYAVNVGTAVSSLSPVAGYTVNNNFSCTAPMASIFTADGAYASYMWDFGDGQTATGGAAVHIYETAGDYTVTLIVSDDNTCQPADTLIVQHGIVIGEIDPVAGFASSGAVITLPVTFQDQSLYGAGNWEWDFGDGTTSTQQNPTHTYSAPGPYDVQLIVHNCHGADTVLQTVIVHDYTYFCQQEFTDHAAGIIYDSGGPFGDYGNNEFCSLVIRPCNAETITMYIDQMELEESYDHLFIYDGTDMWGNLLALYPGFDINDPLVAQSGSLYIEFMSSGDITEAGFRLRYSSELGNIADGNSAAFNTLPLVPVANDWMQFFDLSAHNPVSWFWDFGNGTTSAMQNPFCYYSSAGVYTVTLTVTYCDGFTDVSTSTIVIGNADLEELAEQQLLMVSPNPFGEVFRLSAGETVSNLQIRLFDMSGREVYMQLEQDVPAEGVTVAPQLLSNGQYMLEATYDRNGLRGFERHKIQVNR